MAHHTTRSGYKKLVERLNKCPQGVHPSDLLYQILGMLFSEREAELVSVLPIKPFTVERAAALWKMRPADAQQALEAMADRAVLLDYVDEDGTTKYTLPPPMAGFFEFSLMRVRNDIDQKVLSELFYEYMNVEEDFIKGLFACGKTNLGRVFVQEPVLSSEHALHVLDYERASEVIKTASHIGLGICYCRHKMGHMGRACNAPLEICMTFNTCAGTLIRHGVARPIDTTECLELLDKAYAHNLVQFGENNRERVSFICNCCGCCCEALIAARKFGAMHPVHTSNFIPELDPQQCTGCGKCVAVCPVEAIALVSANDPGKPARKRAKLDEKLCLGCGICVRACTADALRLVPRAERVITPVDSVHRTVVMALERGKLQNLIFDNQVSGSHRAMAAVLGAILKLPPIKRALATEQVKSRYLAALVARVQL